MGQTHNIAVIAGDGIGKEVVPAALSVLKALVSNGEVSLKFSEFEWGSDFYAARGNMMPDDGIQILSEFDAILLGAVGSPGVPDHVAVWGLILPIRQSFDQFVNLRPMRLLDGAVSPLRDVECYDVDMVCVRENTEGEYSGRGRRFRDSDGVDIAEQVSVFSSDRIERIAKYAFDLASGRSDRKVASATKSNALQHSMVLWDEVVQKVADEYADVSLTKYHVDALAARMVTAPRTLDVIVASNLFGDILTDIGAAISGGLGFGAGANIDPSRRYPSMFESIHGSAPDIAGRGVANPIGATWASALMLEHLGEIRAHDRVMHAIEATVKRGDVKTPDMGGEGSTGEMAGAIVDNLGGEG